MNKKPSPAEPVTELRKVRTVECGEPLVDFMGLSPRLVLDRARFDYTRETMVRLTVAEILVRAAESLPAGYRLGVIEGWRPLYIQRRMYRFVWDMMRQDNPQWSEARLRRVVNRYTAPVITRVPPPHTTGGAVDVNLIGMDASPLDHISPYGSTDVKGFELNAPGLDEGARRNRDILAAALSTAGLTNYPSEYWHWSYGDQGWAYRGGHEHAIYSAIQPAGWRPRPEDDTDEPLRFNLR